MARSATSIRSVLRRIIVTTSSGPSGRLPSRLPGKQHSDGRWAVSQVPSNRSDDPPPVATFSLRLSTPCGWNGGVGEVSSLELGTGRGGEVRSWESITSVTRCRTTERSRTSSNLWINETPELKPWVQRWTYHGGWRVSSSHFVLHPSVLVGSRSFASGGNSSRTDSPSNEAPTASSDGSTEVAENAVKSVRDWADAAYNGIMDSAKFVGEAIDVVSPAVTEFIEANPLIVDVSGSVAILTGAWVILPTALRRIHGYVEKGSTALLPGQEGRVPYELSVWKAMEDPARLFATLLTVLQIGMIVAPSPVVAQYITQFWSGGSVLCIVWFLHRWRTNVFNRLLSSRQVTKEERERYFAFNKVSSLGLIFIGGLGLAEASGVPVSSLLTVGGIGGIATAFAAREILANLFTGLTLSFTKPFTVGDVIKAGAVEGKVEEIGMISTRLLTLEKKPIIVPNGFFTSQAIVNNSRAPWQYLAVKIPIRLTDFEKVPTITLEIREMLNRNPQVYLKEDWPRCHIAQFSPSALELAISCNIKPLSKNDYLLVEQEILVEAARIITSSGATLGGP